MDDVNNAISPESDDGLSGKRHTQSKRQPKKHGSSPKPKKLVLHVYGMSSARIDNAIQDIENLCKDCKKQKSLKSPQIQEFVSKMTHDQVSCYMYLLVFEGIKSIVRLCCILVQFSLLLFIIPQYYFVHLFCIFVFQLVV